MPIITSETQTMPSAETVRFWKTFAMTIKAKLLVIPYSIEDLILALSQTYARLKKARLIISFTNTVI
jgi:hypothetical protein